MYGDDAQRTRFIAAFRDLADYLTNHQDVPTPDVSREILVFAAGSTDAERRGLVDQAARALGVAAAGHDGHYTASREFGPLTYTILTISSAAMAEANARDSYWANIVAGASSATPAVTAG